MRTVIETHNLTKLYPGGAGCHEICLSVTEGQIFGFLGPNGAGKSTLVKMLVGLLRPTSGDAHILGKPLGAVEARRKIGFLPELFRYQDWLSGWELLKYHAALSGLDKASHGRAVETALRVVGLYGREKGAIRTYSKGMQQRLGIACAILADPDLVFLDEPTSALDPIGRREVREIILSLKRAGKTVFLNSHLLSEVEMVCDEVAFIREGRIVLAGELRKLLGQGLELDIQVQGLTEDTAEEVAQIYTILGRTSDYLKVKVKQKNDIPDLVDLLTARGCRLFEVTSRTRSLEDLFVELTEPGEVQ